MGRGSSPVASLVTASKRCHGQPGLQDAPFPALLRISRLPEMPLSCVAPGRSLLNPRVLSQVSARPRGSAACDFLTCPSVTMHRLGPGRGPCTPLSTCTLICGAGSLASGPGTGQQEALSCSWLPESSAWAARLCTPCSQGRAGSGRPRSTAHSWVNSGVWQPAADVNPTKAACE